MAGLGASRGREVEAVDGPSGRGAEHGQDRGDDVCEGRGRRDGLARGQPAGGPDPEQHAGDLVVQCVVVLVAAVLPELLAVVAGQHQHGVAGQRIEGLHEPPKLVVEVADLFVVAGLDLLLVGGGQRLAVHVGQHRPSVEAGGHRLALHPRQRAPPGRRRIVEDVGVHQVEEHQGVFVAVGFGPGQRPVDLVASVCRVVVVPVPEPRREPEGVGEMYICGKSHGCEALGTELLAEARRGDGTDGPAAGHQRAKAGAGAGGWCPRPVEGEGLGGELVEERAGGLVVAENAEVVGS